MKKKLLIVLFVLYIFGFGIASLFNHETISFSERRELASFPSIMTSTNKFNTKFFDELDKYFSDHFIWRDEFRMLKAAFVNDVFMMSDNNKIFTSNDYIFEMDPKIKDESVKHFIDITSTVIDKYFEGYDVYYSLIPRKNDYLLDNEHPDFKYQDMYQLLDSQIDYPIIDLYNTLNLNSYYRTDIHWRSEKLGPIASVIMNAMGDEYHEVSFVENTYAPFYGALYAKAASLIEPDKLVYLTSDLLDSVNVYSLEDNANVPIYDLKELEGIDAYSVFVDGPTAYLEITNDKAINDETLIIFRDSYTSSLLPHLMTNYKKLQVVDIRYIGSQYLDQITFDEDAKVLFIYGLEVVNNSYSLK